MFLCTLQYLWCLWVGVLLRGLQLVRVFELSLRMICFWVEIQDDPFLLDLFFPLIGCVGMVWNILFWLDGFPYSIYILYSSIKKLSWSNLFIFNFFCLGRLFSNSLVLPLESNFKMGCDTWVMAEVRWYELVELKEIRFKRPRNNWFFCWFGQWCKLSLEWKNKILLMCCKSSELPN